MDAETEALLRKQFTNIFTPILTFRSINTDLFEEDVEQELYDLIGDILKEKDEETRIKKVFESFKTVAKFLDKVKINIEHQEIKYNRITMITIIKFELDKIADFTQIKGY